MAIATTGKDVLAKFFDEGAYSALYADGAVTAAFGSANGTPFTPCARQARPWPKKTPRRSSRFWIWPRKRATPS